MSKRKKGRHNGTRLPRTGCKCTHCGATGDHLFRRTAYNTLNSWCRDCHRETCRDSWREQQPDAQTRPDRLTQRA